MGTFEVKATLTYALRHPDCTMTDEHTLMRMAADCIEEYEKENAALASRLRNMKTQDPDVDAAGRFEGSPGTASSARTQDAAVPASDVEIVRHPNHSPYQIGDLVEGDLPKSHWEIWADRLKGMRWNVAKTKRSAYIQLRGAGL